MPILADTTGTAFDISFASTFLSNASASITQFWTENQTSLNSILGLIVVLSLIWLGAKLWKKATGKA